MSKNSFFSTVSPLVWNGFVLTAISFISVVWSLVQIQGKSNCLTVTVFCKLLLLSPCVFFCDPPWELRVCFLSLSVSLCVCVCVCVCVCQFVCLSFVCISVSVFVSLCVSVSVVCCVSVSVFVCVCVCVFGSTCVSVYLGMCVCECVYVWIIQLSEHLKDSGRNSDYQIPCELRFQCDDLSCQLISWHKPTFCKKSVHNTFLLLLKPQ